MNKIDKIDPGSVNIPTNSLDSGTLATVLNTTFMIFGAVAVLIIIIGGIQYVTSGGDAGSTSKAKNTILYAVIGLVIVLVSSLIFNVVVAVI